MPKTRKYTCGLELLAAAHAVCFSVALRDTLREAGFSAENIKTSATVASEISSGKSIVTSINLKVRAKVAAATPIDLMYAALKAKLTCPVCRLLNANVSMHARLDR